MLALLIGALFALHDFIVYMVVPAVTHLVAG